MTITHPHKLSQSEAMERTQRLLSDLQVRFKSDISAVRQQWTNIQLTFSFNLKISAFLFSKTYPVSGVVTVNPDNIVLSGKVPLAALVIQSQIKETIQQQMRETYK